MWYRLLQEWSMGVKGFGKLSPRDHQFRRQNQDKDRILECSDASVDELARWFGKLRDIRSTCPNAVLLTGRLRSSNCIGNVDIL